MRNYRTLNLNVDHWDMLAAEPVQSELDFVLHDISDLCDVISPSNIDADQGMPWKYNEMVSIKTGGAE